MKVTSITLLLIAVAAGESSIIKRDVDSDNLICECVPYYQCNYEGTANVNGASIIDIRIGLVGTDVNPISTRRKCEHFLSVCCLPPEMVPSNIMGNNAPSGNTQTSTHDKKNSSIGANGKNHISKGCGYRNPNGISFRITGNYDNEANFAEFPWMVAILRQQNVNGDLNKVYKCGGSLIHPRVVLTAAHCVKGISASELSIRAGEWDTQTVNEPLPHQDRNVAVVASHPNFEPEIIYNDYALLILDSPVNLADNIEVVCLPEVNENFDYQNCFTTGWGKTNFGDKGRFQVILKSVELPIIPSNKCQNNLRNTRLGRYFRLHDTFLCAGGVSGIDACTGDGGSPLVCPLRHDSSRYVQAGIVAWGIGCGEKDVPGVYANVAKGRQWIDQTLVSYHIDSTSYFSGVNNK